MCGLLKRKNNPTMREGSYEEQAKIKELQQRNEKLANMLEDSRTANVALKNDLSNFRKKERVQEERSKKLQEWENRLSEREKELARQEEIERQNTVNANESNISSLKALLLENKKILEDNIYKDKIIKDLHEELQKKNRDFYADIAKPHLKRIIKVHERISNTYKTFNQEKFKGQENAFNLLLNALENDRLMIEDMLNDDYDIEYYEPIVDSIYLPKEHTAIQSISTNIEEKGGKIKECRQGGFKDSNTGKIFKPAVVTVYKYDKL